MCEACRDESVTPMTSHRRYITNTLVIGNGPSGLAASAMLDGWRAYFRHDRPHPDEGLDRLMRQQPVDKSLLDMDIVNMAPDANVGRWLDELERPTGDTGGSVVDWRRDPDHRVPHVVVAVDEAGGSWNTFPDAMKTASIGAWFDLPAYTFAQFKCDHDQVTVADADALVRQRPTIDEVRRYFAAYSRQMNLDRHMHTGVKITSVQASVFYFYH